MRFFSELMIFPRSGRIACVVRSRACFAEPPAESPSTMKSSADCGILDRAVGQLAGKRRVLERALASCQLARLARGLSRVARGDGLRDDLAGLGLVLLEELSQPLVDDSLDETRDSGVAELGLRLAFELRVAELDRDDRGKTLAGVLALEVVVLLLEQAFAARVLVERPRQRRPEPLQMRATLGRVDVVRKREHGLHVRVVPLHRDLDRALVALALEVDDVLVDGVLRLVDVRDEVADPALVEELVRLTARALVAQHDAETTGEESGLAEALQQRCRIVIRLVEHLGVGEERDGRPGLVLAGDADRLHLACRIATSELLAVHLAVASHLRDQPLGERVHDRDTDSVESSRDLVAVAAELSAGVQLREDDRQRGQSLLGNDVDRDAGTGIADGHGVVRMDGHVDQVVASGERLVDRVVDHLVDEVMQAARARRADVHARSQTNGLEALEDSDVFCGVGCFGHQKSPANRHIAGLDKCIRTGGRTGLWRGSSELPARPAHEAPDRRSPPPRNRPRRRSRQVPRQPSRRLSTGPSEPPTPGSVRQHTSATSERRSRAAPRDATRSRPRRR